jgi:hypothetical protein
MENLSERIHRLQTRLDLGDPPAEPTSWPLVVDKDWKTELSNGNYEIHIVHPPSGIKLPILDGITRINSRTTETQYGAESRSIEVSKTDVEKIESRRQGPEEQGMFPDCCVYVWS